MAVNGSAQMQRSAASSAIQASRVDRGVQMMWLDARMWGGFVLSKREDKFLLLFVIQWNSYENSVSTAAR